MSRAGDFQLYAETGFKHRTPDTEHESSVICELTHTIASPLDLPWAMHGSPFSKWSTKSYSSPTFTHADRIILNSKPPVSICMETSLNEYFNTYVKQTNSNI